MSVHGKRAPIYHLAKSSVKNSFRQGCLLASVPVWYDTSQRVADINADVETRVQSILQEMSLEQKVGQMVQGEIKWVSASDVTKYHLGSVLNGGGSFPGGKKNSSIG